MANDLTGDFDVVAEFTIDAVNRVLAAMHSGNRFPHTWSLAVDDTPQSSLVARSAVDPFGDAVTDPGLIARAVARAPSSLRGPSASGLPTSALEPWVVNPGLHRSPALGDRSHLKGVAQLQLAAPMISMLLVNVAGDAAVGSAGDGHLEIFVRGSDGHLWHLWQTAPNGDWSGWEDLSAYRQLGVDVVGDAAVGSAGDGHLEIFVRGSDGHLWHLWQTAPNGDWSGWEDLSAYRQLGVDVVGDAAVGSAGDGHLEIFVRGSDGHLWHLWQTAPNGDWSG